MQKGLKIFICYRHEDSGGYSGRIRDRLVKKYGKRNIFMDVHTIDPGEAFPKKIQDELLSCDIMIAVIGKNWEGKDIETNKSRLENPSDFVRAEITIAVQNGITIIPVLIDGAQIPERLPSSVSEIRKRHALFFYLQTFDTDINNLFRSLNKYDHFSRSKIYTFMLLLMGLGILGYIAYLGGQKAKKTEIETHWEGVWDYTFQGRINGHPLPINGQITLTGINSDQIEGEYTNEGGRKGSVKGTIISDDSRINGIWTSGSDSGRFYFILQSDNNSFRGRYSANMYSDPDFNPNNFWNGIRKNK